MKAYTCTQAEPCPEKRAKAETPAGHLFIVNHPDAAKMEVMETDGKGAEHKRMANVCPHCREIW
jgi:hypothetical protein